MMLSHNVATQMAKSKRRTSTVLQLLEKHILFCLNGVGLPALVKLDTISTSVKHQKNRRAEVCIKALSKAKLQASGAILPRANIQQPEALTTALSSWYVLSA